jgi:hypothetical protein
MLMTTYCVSRLVLHYHSIGVAAVDTGGYRGNSLA